MRKAIFLAAALAAACGPKAPATLGVEFRDPTAAEARALNAAPGRVIAVKRSDPAGAGSRAGLNPGMFVIGINGGPLRLITPDKPAEFRAQLDAFAGKTVMIDAVNMKRTRFLIPIKVPERRDR